MAKGFRQASRAAGILCSRPVIIAVVLTLMVVVMWGQSMLGRWPTALLMVILGNCGHHAISQASGVTSSAYAGGGHADEYGWPLDQQGTSRQ